MKTLLIFILGYLTASGIRALQELRERRISKRARRAELEPMVRSWLKSHSTESLTLADIVAELMKYSRFGHADVNETVRGVLDCLVAEGSATYQIEIGELVGGIGLYQHVEPTTERGA